MTHFTQTTVLGDRKERIVFVNGVCCSIQLRKGHKLRPNGRHYARFDVNDATKRAKVALWAMRSLRGIKLYVVPLTHLRNVSSVYIPMEGKYAVDNNNKPRKDWTRYEKAWHLLGGVKVRTNSGSPRHEAHT